MDSPKEFSGNIIIGFGSADPRNYTLAILKYLSGLRFSGYNIHVVLGPMIPNNHNIKQITSLHDNVWIHEGISDLSPIYEECEMAVCSPGMMFWEMTLFGIKSVLLPSSDREIGSADLLHKLGYAHLLSTYDIGVTDKAIQELISILQGEKMICKNLKKLQSHINPNGINQICAEILDCYR